jgi:hypothetical protein
MASKANFLIGKEWPALQELRDRFDVNVALADSQMDNTQEWSDKGFKQDIDTRALSPYRSENSSPTKNNQHRVYRRVAYMGLEYVESQSDSSKKWYKTRQLWIKEDDSLKEGMAIDGADITMYFFELHEQKGIPKYFGTGAEHLKVKELITYRAITPTQYANWLAGAGLPPSSGSAGGRGGRGRGEAGDPRRFPTVPDVSLNPAGSAARSGSAGGRNSRERTLTEPSRPSFNPAHTAALTGSSSIDVFASGKWDRITSKLEQQRVAMKAIADGVTVSTPPGIIGLGGMKQHISNHLEKAGYSVDQIEWYFNPNVNPLGVTLGIDSTEKTGDAGGNSGEQPPKLTPPTPAVTRLVVRAPVGYTKPAGRGDDLRPHMAQVGSYLSEPDRYYFRQIPNQVSYQGLGSRWVEIPRKGDFPIVEWSDWALMKVQFDFLVAHDMDGLFADVSTDIDQLRRMAQRPLPVSVFGMDQLFSLQMKRAQSTGRAMQFVIADFTVKSARRTVLEGDKEITAAQCSMTLQEIPIEEMSIVEMGMPPMTGPAVPAPKTDGETGSDPKYSDLLPPLWVWDATLLQLDTNTTTHGQPTS